MLDFDNTLACSKITVSRNYASSSDYAVENFKWDYCLISSGMQQKMAPYMNGIQVMEYGIITNWLQNILPGSYAMRLVSKRCIDSR